MKLTYLFVHGRTPIVILLAALLSRPVAGQVPPPPKDEGSAEPQPRLYVAQRIRELGKIVEGEKPEVVWIMENKGNGDLEIEEVKAGCGCTVVALDDDERVIPAGGMLELVAVFDSHKRRGLQRKKVNVQSNDPAEPSLKLEFTAQVEGLFDAKPGTAVNLRMLQRGQTADRALELTPAAGRSGLEVLDITMAETDMLAAEVADLSGRKSGKQVRFTVLEGAALGRIDTTASIDINVDGIVRNAVVPIRGEIVADLVWQPKVVDATRIKSERGRRLTPITVSAAAKTPFEVLSASAGDAFEVNYEQLPPSKQGTRYRFELTVNESAPSGPLATWLVIHTSSLDQPVLNIPVYANIAPVVDVEPPIVVLRKDGTPAGTRRRVKLQAGVRDHLKMVGFQSPNEAIRVTLDEASRERYKHLRYLNFMLDGKLETGVHEFVVTVVTELPGAETISIPVRVEIP
ncbi:MAG: DUF1573 domain-containing protein [Planctomycetota bacterium]|jgi:hypothetical protein